MYNEFKHIVPKFNKLIHIYVPSFKQTLRGIIRLKPNEYAYIFTKENVIYLNIWSGDEWYYGEDELKIEI